MKDNKKQIANEAKQRVIAAIRKGVEATKHHAKMTSRVTDAIKAALAIEFNCAPDKWVVSYKPTASFHGSLEIWDGNLIDYNNRFYSYIDGGRHNPTAEERPWSDRVLEGLKREDTSDYMAREVDEVALYERFAQLDDTVAKMQAAIQEATDEAAQLIAKLPVPAPAVEKQFRQEPHFWTRPSEKATAKFVNLFEQPKN